MRRAKFAALSKELEALNGNPAVADVATAFRLPGSSVNAPRTDGPTEAFIDMNALFPCENIDGNVTLKRLTSVSRVQGTPETFSEIAVQD